MKTKLFFLLAGLCLFSFNVNAQCECKGDGITNNNNGTLTASNADAYFWEVCSGDAVITSGSKDRNLSFECGDRASTISLTTFKNGTCTTTCIEVCDVEPECNCRDQIFQGCVEISFEPCTTAGFVLRSQCLPDPSCIESIEWQVGLGHWRPRVTTNTLYYTYDIPQGNWTNHYLVGRAWVTLTNGKVCKYSDQILIDCVNLRGGDGPSNGLIQDNDDSSTLVYPNPVVKGSHLQIPNNVLKGATSVQFMDSTGKVLSTLDQNDNSMLIPSSINPGIYFVAIKKDQNTQLHKVVVSQN